VKPFTVETFNAGDVAPPAPATLVYVTERPSRAILSEALPDHLWWIPPRGSDAYGWNPRALDRHGSAIQQAWESGRDHGHPGTTPDGFVESWWGEYVPDRRRIGFVGSHLVNNAWGPNKRGERELRRLLWWQGWNAMRREARRLRSAGYTVVRLGDFNRRSIHWPGITDRSIGQGYDRIVYPHTLELLEAWRGDPRGSDHKPLIGRFQFRGGLA
jgi:hypothetical protein